MPVTKGFTTIGTTRERFFVDRTARPGARYAYQVVAEAPSGARSAPSNVQVVPDPRSAPSLAAAGVRGAAATMSRVADDAAARRATLRRIARLRRAARRAPTGGCSSSSGSSAACATPGSRRAADACLDPHGRLARRRAAVRGLRCGLQRAGHAVRICTHPEFRELVTGQGLDFAPLAAGALSRGTRPRRGGAGRNGSRAGCRRGWASIRDARSVAHERMRDAAAGCRDAEVIVATNLTQVLGWQLARERGVPLVRALLNAPAYWMSRRTNRPAAAAVRQGAWLAARPWLNRVRREALGLGPLPLREPIGRLDRERQLALYPFSPSVFPKPAGWGDWTEVTGYWFLDARVDPEPPEDLRAFVEAGPPPVCMGFATQLDPDPSRPRG